MDIRVSRVYAPSDGVGYRVLVDRLWPRGIRKDQLDYDEWCKDVAPSNELRQAFHSGGVEFDQFAERYRQELKESEAPAALLQRFGASGRGVLVLLFGVKNEKQNHAQLLAEHLASIAGED
ncbi:DUF488 domain-containing protein [Brevibacterium daeguense]|uniref:DUF488 domain-containing protein n=1 Tax=Brevibacterium daeguense TaxID=909936 RepID=A0ABP8EGH5_9MICO|nr:DUF488 family protein [Brevibacterium daeguense]